MYIVNIDSGAQYDCQMLFAAAAVTNAITVTVAVVVTVAAAAFAVAECVYVCQLVNLHCHYLKMCVRS